MSAYYFYKNDSHLYVVKKPHRPSPTEDDYLNEYFGQWYLHLGKIKPLLVNCTVAPLAEECLTLHNGSNSSVSTLSYMDQWIKQLLHQHAYTLLISMLLIIVFMAILTITLRTIVQTIRQHKSPASSNDGQYRFMSKTRTDISSFFFLGYYYISSSNSAIEYYEPTNEV